MKIREPLEREAFSGWLDAFRWVAAAVVVISHAGGVLMLPLTYVPAAERPWLQYGYSFVAGFAHYAVMIFFVMSGYLVGGSWIRDIGKGRADIAVYLSKRLTRLGVVFYPVLLLTVPLMLLGQAIFPGAGTGIYPTRAIASGDGLTLACNMAFLQDVFCKVAGGNDALWSLTHEFWYYVAFPLLFFGWGGRVLAVAILALLTWFQTDNAPIFLYFLIWLIGVGVALCPYRRINPWAATAALAAVLVAARVLLHDAAGLPAFAMDMLIGSLFGLLLLALKSMSVLRSPPASRFHQQMAGFSYTLYCTHMPALFLFSSISMAAFQVGGRTTPTSALHWLMVLSGIAFSFVVAFYFARLTEAKTDAIRGLLAANMPKIPVRTS